MSKWAELDFHKPGFAPTKQRFAVQPTTTRYWDGPYEHAKPLDYKDLTIELRRLSSNYSTPEE